ncbi:protein of unknown function [Methylorubrum extorquens]|uniref:Uncharacterized protein n=1 Tax=Methylorubrum extorquens TaxID=408 RepID=A0A2N9ASF6_METEX|nr:protein of unknown function [Methylorubrum extorquens]
MKQEIQANPSIPRGTARREIDFNGFRYCLVVGQSSYDLFYIRWNSYSKVSNSNLHAL